MLEEHFDGDVNRADRALVEQRSHIVPTTPLPDGVKEQIYLTFGWGPVLEPDVPNPDKQQ